MAPVLEELSLCIVGGTVAAVAADHFASMIPNIYARAITDGTAFGAGCYAEMTRNKTVEEESQDPPPPPAAGGQTVDTDKAKDAKAEKVDTLKQELAQAKQQLSQVQSEAKDLRAKENGLSVQTRHGSGAESSKAAEGRDKTNEKAATKEAVVKTLQDKVDSLTTQVKAAEAECSHAEQSKNQSSSVVPMVSSELCAAYADPVAAMCTNNNLAFRNAF